MPLAERAFQQCDLVLAVGCRFAWPQGAHGLTLTQPMIHIDLGPTTSCRAEASTLCVNAPAKLALRFLLDRIAAKPDDGLRDLIRAGKKELRQVLASRPPWTDAVDPVKFFLQLREMMAAEDVLVLDSGHHAFYGIAAYPVWAPRTLLMPVGFRALGFSVPAAVAAKLALPDSRVVACIGDGGFQLTAFELLTARRCNVSPVVVVFADGHLGYVRYHQEHLLGRETCVDLVPVNYEDLAKALGVGYVVVRRDAELKAGLKRALTQEAPLILELRVAYREAAPYLDAVVRSDRQRLPRGMALRLGARLILRKILGR
jgi:acetolactate synthase-1/2/3 large subunit